MTGPKSCAVCKVVGVLVGLGALNWGLVGVFQVDPLALALGGGTTPVARLVYGAIGLAGVLKLLSLVKACPCQRQGAAGCTTK